MFFLCILKLIVYLLSKTISSGIEKKFISSPDNAKAEHLDFCRDFKIRKVMEAIAMKCSKTQYESIKEFIGELDSVSERDFKQNNYLTNYDDGICQMVDLDFTYDRKVYETFDKDIFLKACGIEVKPKVKVFLNPSSDWLENAIWGGGASITSEQLRELTEPKNELKRLKVGGIYKWNNEGTKILMKVTGDDNKEIFGYGFVDGEFSKKVQKWYSKVYYDEAVKGLKETTVEKWEKALLKYKK